jgi:hypothetical protein
MTYAVEAADVVFVFTPRVGTTTVPVKVGEIVDALDNNAV